MTQKKLEIANNNELSTSTISSILMHKVSFRIKLMLLYNFAFECFYVSHADFEIHILNREFVARRGSKKSHRKAHGLFTTFRHYFLLL